MEPTAFSSSVTLDFKCHLESQVSSVTMIMMIYTSKYYWDDLLMMYIGETGKPHSIRIIKTSVWWMHGSKKTEQVTREVDVIWKSWTTIIALNIKQNFLETDL